MEIGRRGMESGRGRSLVRRDFGLAWFLVWFSCWGVRGMYVQGLEEHVGVQSRKSVVRLRGFCFRTGH